MPHPLAVLFVIIALPTCMLLAILVPPGQVADEPAHIARADALRHGVLHGWRRDIVDSAGETVRQAGVRVDANLFEVAFVLHPGRGEKLDQSRLTAHRALPWSGDRPFAEIGTVATYLPLLYIPATIGLAAAYAAGVGPYDAVVAGRLLAVLCFVSLGAAALSRARRGQALMFCVLCCPMTLSLAASFNQDGLLIAASVLAAALATRSDTRSGYGVAVLVACVAAVKLPYLPLAALILMARQPTLIRRVGLACAASLPALLWTGLMVATVAAPTARPPHPGGPLWPGDPARVFSGTDPVAQLQVLFAAPLRIAWLPLHTLIHDPWLIPQGIGVLGWLDVPLPAALYAGWIAAVALAALADLIAARDQDVRWRRSLLLCAAAAASVWAIYLSQYLLWTDVGLDRVNGPTGRYFLPLIPLVALALPSLPLRPLRSIRLIALAAPVVAAFCGLVILPAVVVGAYYLR
jgi:hypothetical protein